MEPKFKNREEYLEWCHQQVIQIYYGNIAMNNTVIGKVVEEVANKLHCVEGQELYGYDEQLNEARTSRTSRVLTKVSCP